jgi:hypothetical protein
MFKEKISQVLTDKLTYPESKNLQQRGIADKIEDKCTELLKENFDNATDPSSRRSIEDVSIGNTFIDTKTSDESLDFKMPNMISIDRLRKNIIDINKDLLYNFVIYNSQEKKIKKVFLLQYYELNWDHLSIQNLGKGQLQIRNMKDFLEDPISKLSKDEWINKFKEKAIDFYKKVESDAIKRQNEWKKWI